MRQRLLAYASLLLLLGGLAYCTPLLDRLVLFPSTSRIDPQGAARRAIPFENGELEIWTASSEAARRSYPKIYVLRFYGNADRAERWVAEEAEMFGDRSVEVWGMNYPGFGGSTGPARLRHVGPAALAAYDALRETAGARPIFVFGTSLGSTAALHLTAQRPVAGAIIQNPPALRQMILRQFGWWNLWLLAGPLSLKVPAALNSVANARASRVPVIFLLAGNDEVVAPRFQRLVADAYAGEKREIFLPGAHHNSPIAAKALRDFQEALAWLLPSG